MRPTARILVDGQDLFQILQQAGSELVSVTVTDEAGVKSDTCEIEIDNRARRLAPAIGSEVEVWLGYEPEPVRMGRYKVDSWTKKGPVRTISISAKAAELTKEIKATKTRSHHDTTVGDIVNKIAGEHGLGVAIDSSLASRKIEHIDQQTESDMGFLSRLAKRHGATFKLTEGMVVFTGKGSKTQPDGSAKIAVPIFESDLSDWSATCNERGGHKSVKCEYRDVKTGERVTITFGGGAPCHRDRKLYATKDEAEAAAKATLGDLTRGKMTVDINGPGNPLLSAERLVALSVNDADVDGEYLAKSVTHTFTGSGYTTSANLETEGSNSG